MASPKKASIYTDRKFEITPDRFIPLRIYQELRRGFRATVGKKQLIFRLPHGMLPAEQQRTIDKLSDWARTTYRQKPAAFVHLLPQGIKRSGSIVVMDVPHAVKITTNERGTSHQGIIEDVENPVFNLQMVPVKDDLMLENAVKTLLSRLSSQKYLPKITERVNELNEIHFRQPIKNVKLRLTQTRWGSCSSTGNINLSSRLLLAPAEARDSVIIHELAHRIEMNHSNRFWKLVYDAMPDYDEYHNYLNTYGNELRFIPK